MTKKTILLLLLALSLKSYSQKDSLFNSQYAGLKDAIKTFDINADIVKKQKVFFRRNLVKIKYSSSTNKAMSGKVRLKISDGKTVAKYKLQINHATKIKMSTVDNSLIFIERRDFDKNISSSFFNIGSSKWYFHYAENGVVKKYYVTVDLNNWR